MELHFGRMYKLAICAKMLPMMHGTAEQFDWSCTPPVKVSTEH